MSFAWNFKQARVDVKVVLLGSSGVGKTCLLERCELCQLYAALAVPSCMHTIVLYSFFVISR